MSPLSQERVTDPADPLVAELVERQYRSRIRFRYADEAAGRAAAADLVAGLLPDSRLAPSLLPGEPVRETLVADGSFRLVATNMRLDVTGDVPGEELADRVEVVAMTDAEVAEFSARAVLTYAQSREEAGESAELALKTARTSFDENFPGGRPAPGQHVVTLRHEGRPAGVLWVGERWPAQAWVYEVEIEPALRGRGLGAAAMVHAARWARAEGMAWLGLNVFGPNRHARGLYERLSLPRQGGARHA